MLVALCLHKEIGATSLRLETKASKGLASFVGNGAQALAQLVVTASLLVRVLVDQLADAAEALGYQSFTAIHPTSAWRKRRRSRQVVYGSARCETPTRILHRFFRLASLRCLNYASFSDRG